MEYKQVMSKKRMKKKIKKKWSIFLTIAGPAIVIIYLTLDHFGIVDKLTKQDVIETAIARLENTGGYPSTYIYNDSIDKRYFTAIFKLIKKNRNYIRGSAKEMDILRILDEGHIPSLIATAGKPIKIEGVVDAWPQEDRFFYTDNHPILMIFNSPRKGSANGKGGKVCSLGELKKWAKNSKLNLTYIIGGLGVSLFTVAITLLQQRID